MDINLQELRGHEPLASSIKQALDSTFFYVVEFRLMYCTLPVFRKPDASFLLFKANEKNLHYRRGGIGEISSRAKVSNGTEFYEKFLRCHKALQYTGSCNKSPQERKKKKTGKIFGHAVDSGGVTSLASMRCRIFCRFVWYFSFLGVLDNMLPGV